MIFSVAQTISYLSKGTTLEKGSVILMGTPSGIGWHSKPRRVLRDGDTFSITYGGGIGTLVNTFQYE
jgi:2-keto-4-pentenoate hydratase/2-oxohepta-3-ene-1,7-dioic acid hydratase in catechol pathway